MFSLHLKKIVFTKFDNLKEILEQFHQNILPFLKEIIMNFVGTFMFVAVGGTALHYWHGYQPEQKFMYDAPERQVSRIPNL